MLGGGSPRHRQGHGQTSLTRANTLPADVTSKTETIMTCLILLIGGEGGIRTPGTVLPVQRFSKPSLSATQPPLRVRMDPKFRMPRIGRNIHAAPRCPQPNSRHPRPSVLPYGSRGAVSAFDSAEENPKPRRLTESAYKNTANSCGPCRPVLRTGGFFSGVGFAGIEPCGPRKKSR